MDEPLKTLLNRPSDPPGEPAELTPTDALRRLGHYQLLKELGRGAQGVVYLAEDVKLRRKVALKMLAGADIDSHVVRQRFQREAELTSKFAHPGICGVHEVGAVDGVPYIAMQFVQGVTLAEILERAKKGADGAAPGEGTVSDSLAILHDSGSKGQQLHDLIKLLERAARALHVAHEAGLVHRDVKPGNIMVTPEGNPVLLDFGIARDLHAEGAGLTQSGQIIGTPAYLAPEQIVASRGAVDRRTDVYALGVILFECLTLRRPHHATSWDQLFNQILHGDAPSPRLINPRIPPDLCTVIEVAMERDQARRYPTAEALADDLRRVRAFEPIEAKAAGPIARGVKWARRNPGKATAAGAATLFAAAAAGFFGYQSLDRSRAVRENLRRAEEQLAAGAFTEALEAAAAAREYAPRSAEALELRTRIERAQEAEQLALRKRADFELATEARAEALELRDRHAAGAARSAVLARDLLRERSAVLARAASTSEREDFARRERELEQLQIENEQLMVDYNEALQRAARRESVWGEVGDATEAALAEHFMVRWRLAHADGDEARAAAMGAAATRHDRSKAHERELLGRGTLTIAVEPPEAELHLFRYEDLASLSTEPAIPRLVPVPTLGVGRASGAWSEALAWGEACLVVRAVETDSPAARAGLRPGDLVTRIHGQPCGAGLFVVDAAVAGPLASAGAPPAARLAKLADTPLDGGLEFLSRALVAAAERPILHLAGRDEPIECAAADVRVLSAAEVVAGLPAAALALDVLRSGEPATLLVEAGEASGLTCELSAYPLVFASENRVEAGAALSADPGAYLVVGRAAGRELQRFHVLVERLADARVEFELAPLDAAPEGFVFVPGGPFVVGGDAQAFQPRLAERVDVAGFYIARKELTNREWYEFVNDPATLERLRGARPGTCLPRDDRILARPLAEGAGFTWDVFKHTSADSPVLGLSWTDVREYLTWRNARAAEAGEEWRYDLPTEVEWEKAARGVDGRRFPWGNRFDPLLAVSMVRSADFLLDAPGGSEPRDESPYGVLDLAGSREEWLRELVPGSEPPRYYKRGGRWNSYVESVFRSASRGEASQDFAASGQGLRLVLRRP
jgi:formylglycine-generating enzyme required for sulfatase activity/tRNA A-37 threonylcarbamoyl transferase component Bud32